MEIMGGTDRARIEKNNWVSDKAANRPSTHQTYNDYVTSYLESTSAHGLSKLRDSSPGKRYTWKLLILLNVVCVSYLIYAIGRKIQFPPIVTKISTHVMEGQQLPAFTLCNHNLYNRTAILSDRKVLASFLMTLSNLTIDQEAKAAIVADLGISSSDYQSIVLTSAIPDINYDLIFIRLAHSKEGTFEDAFIKSPFHCILENITIVLADKNICFTYDKLGMVTESGSKVGVELILNVHPELYTLSEPGMYLEGFKIAFHQTGDIPVMDDIGMNLEAGHGYLFGMRKVKRKYRQHCVSTEGALGADKRLAFFDKYTRNNCIQECEGNFTISKCGCRLSNQAGSLASMCTNPRDVSCAINVSYRFNSDKDGRRACDCPRACEEVEFEAHVSTSAYPSQYSRRINKLRGANDTGSEGRLSVTYFFETLEETSIEQTEAYSFSDAWGDLGGVLGLCLGASLMTIIETIEFVVGLFILVWNRRGTAKTSSKDGNG